VLSDQCQLDRVHSHGPQACPSPVSAAQNAVVLWSPGLKTPDPPNPPVKTGLFFARFFPGGFGEKAGEAGGPGKRALQVCGGSEVRGYGTWQWAAGQCE
jgi:hypothetical protein